jgi:hypothetical protein
MSRRTDEQNRISRVSTTFRHSLDPEKMFQAPSIGGRPRGTRLEGKSASDGFQHSIVQPQLRF